MRDERKLRDVLSNGCHVVLVELRCGEWVCTSDGHDARDFVFWFETLFFR